MCFHAKLVESGMCAPIQKSSTPQSVQVQDFRRNVLDICESSVKKRTSSDLALVLYNYPPNLVAVGTLKLDEVELIEADISFYSSDGKQLKTTLKVDHAFPLYFPLQPSLPHSLSPPFHTYSLPHSSPPATITSIPVAASCLFLSGAKGVFA